MPFESCAKFGGGFESAARLCELFTQLIAVIMQCAHLAAQFLQLTLVIPRSLLGLLPSAIEFEHPMAFSHVMTLLELSAFGLVGIGRSFELVAPSRARRFERLDPCS